jgi:hypothetical protein
MNFDLKVIIKYIILFLLLIIILLSFQSSNTENLTSVIKYQQNMSNNNIIDITDNISINYSQETSNSHNSKWNRNKCNYIMSQSLVDVLNENNIIRDEKDWDLFLPCGYDEISSEMEIMPKKINAKYFIIDNIDLMTAKEWLWLSLLKHHGLQKSLQLMPMTYVLSNQEELLRLMYDFNKDKSKIYILKKNIQRQEGLKITNNIEDIKTGFSNGYVVAQELLQNPFIIDGRKTNMRVYVLITCYGNHTTVYVYNDGFMYYTKEPFVKGSLEDGPNITTGYIERSVYERNPLTHGDLKKYLDDPKRKLNYFENNIKQQGMKISNVVFDRIYKTLYDVFISFVGQIGQNKKFYDNMKFQLFGIDIAMNDELQIVIIECNKGPDMGAKDKRDSELKMNVTRDMMKIIQNVDDKNSNRSNGFIKILNI